MRATLPTCAGSEKKNSGTNHVVSQYIPAFPGNLGMRFLDHEATEEEHEQDDTLGDAVGSENAACHYQDDADCDIINIAVDLGTTVICHPGHGRTTDGSRRSEDRTARLSRRVQVVLNFENVHQFPMSDEGHSSKAAYAIHVMHSNMSRSMLLFTSHSADN